PASQPSLMTRATQVVVFVKKAAIPSRNWVFDVRVSGSLSVGFLGWDAGGANARTSLPLGVGTV
ncbi:MAG: hypothetical protein AAFY11_14965, partial [Cyanobacteria bacterium J06641_5]